jgi:hypothetical protein
MAEEADMKPQQTTGGILKSSAGAFLAGLGTYILYANAAGAVGHLCNVLANGSETLGGLPAAVVVLTQSVHAHALEHQGFVQSLFQHALVSSIWPLFLVVFGTALSRETFTEDSTGVREDESKAINLSRSRGLHK